MAHESGNIQPQLDLEEHLHASQAKRVAPVHLSDLGQYVNTSSFEYTASNPLAVVLVDPTSGSGDPYVASGGAGGNVTAHIAASVTLFAVTSGGGPAGEVTAFLAASVTLNAEVGIASSTTLFGEVRVAASVTIPVSRGLILSSTRTWGALTVTNTTSALILATNLTRASYMISVKKVSGAGTPSELYIGPESSVDNTDGQQIFPGGAITESGDGITTDAIYGYGHNGNVVARFWERDRSA